MARQNPQHEETDPATGTTTQPGAEVATPSPPQAEAPGSSPIDPKSTLPEHLQPVSYSKDIWQRVKSHPIPNPNLTRSELQDTPETREIVRQVIAAGEEREKEILLHNQARLFQEILGRVLYTAWQFLGTPLYPGAGPPAPLLEQGKNEQPTQARSAQEPKWKRLAKSAGLGLLTPKYYLLGALLFFMFASGYSFMQVEALKRAVETYKLAASATEHAQFELESLSNSYETDKAKFAEDLHRSDARISELEKTESRLLGEKAELESALSLNTITEATLDESQQMLVDAKKQVDDLTTLSERRRVRLDDATDQVRQLAQSLEDRTRQMEVLRRQNTVLVAQNGVLENESILLESAHAFVEQIRRQVGARRSPNEREIEAHLRRYDAVRNDLLRR